LRLVEEIGRDIEVRTIRAWHYTRLTEAEMDNIRINGIYLSTLETLRRRLDAAVADGLVEAEIAEALFMASPFHEQIEERSNKFWMTSYPRTIDDRCVTLRCRSLLR
jgi:hypothetical protein